MDFITAVRCVHLAASALWVGGGFSMVFGGLSRREATDPKAQIDRLSTIAFLGPWLFLPAGLATLVTGFAMIGDNAMALQPFVVLGFGGVVFSILFGILVLGPSASRAVDIADDRCAIAALPEVRRFARLARIDLAVRLAVMLMMTVKPDWTETAVIAGLVALALLAGFAGIAPSRQPVARPTALASRRG